MAFEDDSQAGSPFVHRAAFRGGERHRGFRQASADGELATGPAQPGVEIRAVGLGGEHAASRGPIATRGQEFATGLSSGVPAIIVAWNLFAREDSHGVLPVGGGPQAVMPHAHGRHRHPHSRRHQDRHEGEQFEKATPSIRRGETQSSRFIWKLAFRQIDPSD